VIVKTEIDFERLEDKEEKKTTKILDRDEITNIKSLLNDTIDMKEENLKLDDVDELSISSRVEKEKIDPKPLTKNEKIEKAG